MIQKFRGWGRSVRRAVSKWYNEHHSLEYQVTKYRNRNGWTHRDVLRKAHVKPASDEVASILKWCVSGEVSGGSFIKAMSQTVDVNATVKLIESAGLAREHVPQEHLSDVRVWDALSQEMPMTALIRNLGKMSSIGLIKPLSKTSEMIASLLRNAEKIRKSRIHPFSVLLALKTYSDGRGFRGSLTWNVDNVILDALNSCYHLSFKNIEPTGKRFLFGIDVSGSMGATINNTNVQCREAAAALAMASIRVEDRTHCVGFTAVGPGWSSGTKLTELAFSKQDTLQTVLQRTSGLSFGRTDCALPMIYAKDNNLEVDCFVVVTDNETYAGNIHPSEALNQYRKSSGIDAKLVVCGMTATGFTIADPADAGMLDIVGFDASGPKVISEFAAN